MLRKPEIREGFILSAEPGRAIVRLTREETDCGGCRSCALQRLCPGHDAAHVDIPVAIADGKTLTPGIRVKVAYESGNPAKAAVVLFLPSLIGLLLGGWLANTLFGEGNGVFLAGTGCGVFAALALACAVNRAVGSAAPKSRLVDTSLGSVLQNFKISERNSVFYDNIQRSAARGLFEKSE